MYVCSCVYVCVVVCRRECMCVHMCMCVGVHMCMCGCHMNYLGTYMFAFSPSVNILSLSGLKGRVRSRHQQFINTLLIDGQLLAALHEKELLSELQRQELHARIDRNDAPMRTSNYFVGSVVFQWPSSVFDRNLRELSKALAEHSDPGNKYLGQMFDQILTSPSPD